MYTVHAGGESTLRNRIIASVALTNQAYDDSNMPMSLRLAVVPQLVAYTESGDGMGGTSLDDLTYGRIAGVHELRTAVSTCCLGFRV
jgi:hypothetical protein